MKISIITPSFNQGKYLKRTILSVLNQGFTNLEFMIFDGGSDDDSVEVIEQFQPHVAHWVSEPDRGQAHAVNKGLERAKGDVIGWLNSDDIYYPGALDTVAAYFQEHPDCMFVYGKANYIDPNDRVIGPYRTRKWSYSALTRNCYICQPSVFFRRSVVDRFGVLDESLQYCMDYEYWLRCGKLAPFTYLDVTLSASRLYPENKTLSSRPQILEEACAMLQRTLGHVPRRWLGEYALESVANELPANGKRLRKSLKAMQMWHELHWQFNHGVLPRYPLQMLASLPVFPRGMHHALRQLAQ